MPKPVRPRSSHLFEPLEHSIAQGGFSGDPVSCQGGHAGRARNQPESCGSQESQDTGDPGTGPEDISKHFLLDACQPGSCGA